ncbi:cystathionine beta-lyase [Bifidobacterium ramosum]|uniref:cysteine-S-conjugate beta-lyase n=1 Tax=Bifidobacterium ramosum TaxID=1798158 RepID=A0A6L4WZ80_9BIFI|nr:MalY/PatB family protein [Bifidobacterium ramosum]KAB8287029.1 cystathionine beta-lyase [Bifidobacterium ramosum]NEG72464.1 aminotransferase class I/II-fold pyridoxal phosphate-dependent enzyme [Bifidobacterium ramosum]
MTVDFDTPVDRSGTDSLKWEEAGDALPMWVADMDFATAPAIREALQRRFDNGVFGYSIVPDAWEQAYVDWWGTRHGLVIDPQSLIFTTGVIPAISSMVRKLTTPAENVVIQTPVYNIFFNSILNNGRNALESQLAYDAVAGRYTIDWADLEAKLADPQTSLMILCNPHNPTGMIWDRATLARIGDLCWEHHVTVISDEIHCDLTDPGAAYVPFASVNERCAAMSVTCMAPTKAFNIAGLHTAAVMVPDPTLRHKVWRGLNTDEVAEPNAFAIPAAIAAFEHGGEWLDELRAYLADNKREARRMIDEYNSTASADRQVTLVSGPATYLLWLDCAAFIGTAGRSAADDDADGLRDDGTRRTGGRFADATALCDWLRREHRVMFSSGVSFGGNGSRFIRVNVACPRSQMREAFIRLFAALVTL